MIYDVVPTHSKFWPLNTSILQCSSFQEFQELVHLNCGSQGCPTYSVLVQCCPTYSVLVQCCPTYSVLVQCCPTYSVLVQCCPTYSKLECSPFRGSFNEVLDSALVKMCERVRLSDSCQMVHAKAETEFFKVLEIRNRSRLVSQYFGARMALRC